MFLLPAAREQETPTLIALIKSECIRRMPFFNLSTLCAYSYYHYYGVGDFWLARNKDPGRTWGPIEVIIDPSHDFKLTLGESS